MVGQNSNSIKFLQLTHSLHVLQVTLANIRPDKLKKEKKENKARRQKKEGTNVMIRLVKALLPPIR